MQEDTGLVVALVSESSPGSLDVLDPGVGGLGAGVGDTGDDRDLDLWPPRADRVPQPGGLGHVRGQDVGAQAHLLVLGGGQAGAGQQAA